MLRTKITSVLADGILALPHLKGQGEKLRHSEGGGEKKKSEAENEMKVEKRHVVKRVEEEK